VSTICTCPGIIQNQGMLSLFKQDHPYVNCSGSDKPKHEKTLKSKNYRALLKQGYNVLFDVILFLTVVIFTARHSILFGDLSQ
jgi:hypothetical protein